MGNKIGLPKLHIRTNYRYVELRHSPSKIPKFSLSEYLRAFPKTITVGICLTELQAALTKPLVWLLYDRLFTVN